MKKTDLAFFSSFRRRDSGQGYSSGIASDGSITDSPSSKSPARRRRRLGSEVSSSGYESMRDGTTSHVSGSDSADEKGMVMDRSNSGNILNLDYFFMLPFKSRFPVKIDSNTFLSLAKRRLDGSLETDKHFDDFERLRLGGIDELRVSG